MPGRKRLFVMMMMTMASLCTACSGVKTPLSGEPAADSVEAVLQQLADFYKQVEACRLEVSQSSSFEQGAEKATLEAHFDVALERPNRASFREPSGDQMQIISDGERLFTLLPESKSYMEEAAPPSFDALASSSPRLGMIGMGNMMVIALLGDDPRAALLNEVTSSTYAGRTTVDGKAAHHLKFEQPRFDWELFVAAEGDPVLIRAFFDFSKQFTGMNGQEGVTSVVSSSDFTNWQFQPLPDETFAFAPTPDMTKLGGGASESSLVGKPAPDFTTVTLDGDPFTLSEQYAQNIVMLDFWATWCGPCVAEMPVLEQVAKKYAQRGVKLFAVNQQEQPEAIRSFLAEQKLAINTVLDADGAIGSAYQVESIPMLVLIDKQGIVRNVHVGFREDLESVLQRELDALLADPSPTGGE